MIKSDPALIPDWDEDNVAHIQRHGIRPEQVEELYYGEGPLPTLALKNKRQRRGVTEHRYRLWGTDASGVFLEAVVAPYPEYGVWRCVTAFAMSDSVKHAYLKRIGR